MPRKSLSDNKLFQIQGTLGKESSDFEKARRIILDWVSKKSNLNLSQAERTDARLKKKAHDGTLLQIERQGDMWALRLKQPDAIGRLWNTEITLLRENGLTQANIERSCSNDPNGNAIVPRMPEVVNSLIASVGLHDYGEKLDGKYRVVAMKDDTPSLPSGIQKVSTTSLASLIENPNRTRPVVVLALDGRKTDPSKAAGDPELIADMAGSLAHVFVIMPEAREFLSRKMGEEWGIARRSARIFQPGFTSNDNPERHPAISAINILEWPSTHERKSFAQHVFETACKTSLNPTLIDRTPDFAAVSREVLETQAQKSDVGIEDRFNALQEAYEALKEKAGQLENENTELWRMVQEKDVYLEQFQNAYARAEKKIEDQASEIEMLKKNRVIITASKSILESWRTQSYHPAELPQEYKEIPEWVDTALNGRLILLPSARADLRDEAKKKNAYAWPGVICESLLFLADDYWRLKTDKKFTRNQFIIRSRQCGFEVTRMGVPPINKDLASCYFVKDLDGKDLQIEMHLKGDSKMSREHCLRVYFNFDKERKIVKVGHLPGHLKCSIT